VKIRACNEHDADAIHAFVGTGPPLTLHTPFTYWVILRYWGSVCFVAEDNDQIVGLITSVGAVESADLLYVWQIGVDGDRRGKRLAQGLLDCLQAEAHTRGYLRFQVSIASDNGVSFNLFERAAREQGSVLQEKSVEGDEPTYEWHLNRAD